MCGHTFPPPEGSRCSRARKLTDNIDHLRVEWMKWYIQDCLGYARVRLSVFIQVWTWSSCQTTN